MKIVQPGARSVQTKRLDEVSVEHKKIFFEIVRGIQNNGVFLKKVNRAATESVEVRPFLENILTLLHRGKLRILKAW